jgi:hypothetical protein
MRKEFSEEQHQQDDRPAKAAVADYLVQNWGVFITEGDTYGVDLYCYRDGKLCGYVEVERRHNWVDDFPFPTVHVPARKSKFFNLDLPTVLFSVRSDLKKALWCPGEIIHSSDVQLLDNKHCEQEDFYVVPLDYWTLVDL